MGGAGGDDYALALKMGCDTYVTADVKYHIFMECKALGLNLIDAGHFPTENVVIPHLQNLLTHHFSGVDFVSSQKHSQTEQFYL